MSEPVMQSPLHHFGLAAKAKPIDASCGVWASEMPLLGYVSLRGDAGDAAFVEAASRALDAQLPATPCTFAASGDTSVLWLSADEWMIVGQRPRLEALAAALEQALTGLRSQVVKNSGGYTQVLVTGPDAARVLAHCTVYDLDKLTDGRVVGTTFGKSSVIVRRAPGGFCLLLRRSFADYIWRFLERAAAPYGFGVAKRDTGVPGAPGLAA